jgi:hypothetical protein
MTKEQYIKELEIISEANFKLTKRKLELRSEYIEANKPCNIDDIIEVVTNGGRKVVGEAKSFEINQHKDVFVSSIEPETGSRVYLSDAHKSIKVL